MERLAKRENGHAHYQRCFEEPCGGMGCRTEDCEFNVEICERLAAYEDTGLTPEQCAEYAKADREGRYIVLRDAEQEGVKRLRELAKADKEGRLVVLPCKSGDTVYEVTSRKTISEYRVKAIRVELFWTFIEWDIVAGFVDKSNFGVPVNEIGKSVFLTREEAERALQEMEGKA